MMEEISLMTGELVEEVANVEVIEENASPSPEIVEIETIAEFIVKLALLVPIKIKNSYVIQLSV